MNLDPAALFSAFEHMMPTFLDLHTTTRRVVTLVGLKNLREAGELKKGITSYQWLRYGNWRVTTKNYFFPRLYGFSPLLAKVGLVKLVWDASTYVGCSVNCLGAGTY